MAEEDVLYKNFWSREKVRHRLALNTFHGRSSAPTGLRRIASAASSGQRVSAPRERIDIYSNSSLFARASRKKEKADVTRACSSSLPSPLRRPIIAAHTTSRLVFDIISLSERDCRLLPLYATLEIIIAAQYFLLSPTLYAMTLASICRDHFISFTHFKLY